MFRGHLVVSTIAWGRTQYDRITQTKNNLFTTINILLLSFCFAESLELEELLVILQDKQLAFAEFALRFETDLQLNRRRNVSIGKVGRVLRAPRQKPLAIIVS